MDIKNTKNLHEDKLTKAEKISKYITDNVGTIWCAIIFCILALISLPAAIASCNAIVIIG